MKMLALLMIVRSRHFDNATDGFVYGVAVGLGFGMMENFIYFGGSAVTGTTGEWFFVVAARTLTTAPMHSVATGIVGIALGYAKLRPWRHRLVAAPAALLLAMVVHGVWNGLQVLDPMDAETGVRAREALLIAGEVVVLLGVYQALLWRESGMIRRELTGEAELGTLPMDHVAPLSSWLARLRSRRWLPVHIAAPAYVEAATLLAFRRYQQRLMPGDAFYGTEIERLRQKVQRLMTPH